MTARFRAVLAAQFLLRTAVGRVVLLVALLCVPSVSRAQRADDARIAADTRVLVRTRDGAQGEWRLEHASRDSLTLRRRIGDTDERLSLPWSETERVDTMAIAPPSARRTLVGGALGGLVGLGVAYAGARLAPCNWDGGDCPAIGFIVLSPAIIGTGIVVGGTIGYRHRNWHWSTAWRAPTAPDR